MQGAGPAVLTSSFARTRPALCGYSRDCVFHPSWQSAFSGAAFSVPRAYYRSRTGLFRLCLDLRPCNTCIIHRTFKMEGIDTVKELLQPGDWCGKIDLRGAYLQIRFDQDLCRLLRFTWRGRAFECLTLMFGLSEAPWLFSKTMRAPVR